MKTRWMMTIFAAAALVACGTNHDAEHGHDHDQDHGHASESAANDSVEAESWAVTAWGEHFELFPEIDALVVNQIASSHVHVTVLDGFAPVTVGSVTLVFTGPGGSEERFSSNAVIRPGIFNVENLPRATGQRELHFEVEANGVTESIPGGTVHIGTVHAPGGLVEQPHTLPSNDGGEEVGFLKEQQWRTTFATEWAELGALQSSVTGTARVEPPSGGNVVLTAPVDGVVRGTSWPYTGQSIAADKPLLSLIPTAPDKQSLAALEASVEELLALSDAATARTQRLEALLVREAVSQREVEQARAEATGLKARLQAGRTELAAAEAGRTGRRAFSGFEIRAPFLGRVAEVLVSPGEHVAAGASLVRVVREKPVWLRIALTPADSASLSQGISGVVLDTGASAIPTLVPSADLRLVAIAPEVDPRSGTVEALIEVRRSVDQLKPGLRATAQILLSGSVEGMVLPYSSVIDDAGVPVVYVQLSGESFSRREVTVLHRQGELLMVDGVVPGERVVTVGGAAIRRASLLSSGSVEGHVH